MAYPDTVEIAGVWTCFFFLILKLGEATKINQGGGVYEIDFSSHALSKNSFHHTVHTLETHSKGHFHHTPWFSSHGCQLAVSLVHHAMLVVDRWQGVHQSGRIDAKNLLVMQGSCAVPSNSRTKSLITMLLKYDVLYVLFYIIFENDLH